jgi:hypothetical protein
MALTEFISWVLRTVVTAAEAEMNDDTALREQLLEAEMRREMGEISDEEFKDLEAAVLARIREIKARKEGGTGPISMGAQPIETSEDNKFQVEATVSGDFYDPADAPHTRIIETEPDYEEDIEVLDIEPGQAEAKSHAALPLSASNRVGRAATGSPKRSRRKLRKS